MLRISVFVFVVVCAAAVFGPDFLSRVAGSHTAESRSDGRNASALNSRSGAASSRKSQTAGGRTVRLKKGRGGHYHADVRVNGRKFSMMVDTGASLIALTARDARRMGVYPGADKFIYEARTANGVARIALVELKQVRIGGIRVDNVKASVHQGKGLDTNLLGMSFLNRLRKFDFEGDTLTLVN